MLCKFVFALAVIFNEKNLYFAKHLFCKTRLQEGDIAQVPKVRVRLGESLLNSHNGTLMGLNGTIIIIVIVIVITVILISIIINIFY